MLIMRTALMLSYMKEKRVNVEGEKCMIETENLTRKFGELTAVDNVTLKINKGEVFGFLGPNGAGKTTTVRMLCCLISKTSGKARLGDFDVDREEDRLKKDVWFSKLSNEQIISVEKFLESKKYVWG